MTRRELCAQIASEIDTALEIKTHDEGHYGKRDWALVKVLVSLRELMTMDAKPDRSRAKIRCVNEP